MRVYAGERRGRLTAVSKIDGSRPGKWLFQCSCGRTTITRVSCFRKGSTTSCGCRSVECLTLGRLPTHSGTKRPEYAIWAAVKRRCRNPNVKGYSRYGGRGIKLCERWDSFVNFFADVGPRPSPRYSIDRIDVNGHYEPGNVRWSTVTAQARNRRTSRRFFWRGATRSLAEICEVERRNYKLVHAQIQRGRTLHSIFGAEIVSAVEARYESEGT